MLSEGERNKQRRRMKKEKEKGKLTAKRRKIRKGKNEQTRIR
jgi:hypothetical protein